jgi:hypothetical protein
VSAVWNYFHYLPLVWLTPVENLPPVSLTPVANLPPVSTTLAKPVAKFAADVVDTGGKFAAGVINTAAILPVLIWNGPNGILWFWGETDSWKKPEA